MFFNTKRQSNIKTHNLAGGEAFTETPKLELLSVLLTSTLKDEFYRKADATVNRVKQLVAEIPDKSFSAKAAVYARNEVGMRSVTHLVAGEIAKSVKGQAWTAPFYRKLCRRPDDALEILACYTAQYGRPIPNALKKGLGQALAEFDAYQLAKYRRQGAELSLVDLVNLVHPPHSEPLAQLMKGSLAPAETWESALTQAGQKAESEDEAEANKAEAWEHLIKTRKLGYFALLRNLRNILSVVPHLMDDVLAMLTDGRLIKRSLVQQSTNECLIFLRKGTERHLHDLEIGGALDADFLSIIFQQLGIECPTISRLPGAGDFFRCTLARWQGGHGGTQNKEAKTGAKAFHHGSVGERGDWRQDVPAPGLLAGGGFRL